MKRKYLLIPLILAVILLSACDSFKGDYSFKEINKWELKERQQVYVKNNKILSFRDGKFRITALEDINDIKRFPINIEKPILKATDEFIYLANSNTGTIYKTDYNAEIVSKIELKEPVFNIKIVDGYILYHLKTSIESIGVISPESSRLLRLDFQQKILDFDYNPNTEQTAVALFDTMGSGSKVFIHKGMDVDSVIDIDSELVLSVEIMELGNYLILTDSNLYYYSGDEIVWKIELELLKDFYVDNKDIFLLDRASLREINLRGKTLRREEYIGGNDKLKYIDKGLFKEEIFIYGDGGITGFINGKRRLDEERNITDFFIDGERYFILDGENLREVELVLKEDLIKEQLEEE